MGVLFPIYGKIKFIVPNHQPDYYTLVMTNIAMGKSPFIEVYRS